MSAEHVAVRIFGETYPLRTGEPAARLAELAAFVDARMREVASTGKVVATNKIAVLAALHIADELFRTRERLAAASGGDEARIAALVAKLDAILAPAAPPPQT